MKRIRFFAIALWVISTGAGCTYEPTQNTRLAQVDEPVAFKGFYIVNTDTVDLQALVYDGGPGEWVEFGSVTPSASGVTDPSGAVWYHWQWSGPIPQSAWVGYPDAQASIRFVTDIGELVVVDDDIADCAEQQGYIGAGIVLNCQSSVNPEVLFLRSCVPGMTYSDGECVGDRDFDGVPDTTDNCPDFPNPEQSPPVPGSPPGDECRWSVNPFVMSEIHSIVPLGTVSGGEVKNRLQIQIEETTPRTKASVFAPVDMKVKLVRYSPGGNPPGEVEYWGFFAEVTREEQDRGIVVGFDHITHPEAKLMGAIPPVPVGYVSPTSPISFSAGEKIGETIGSALAGAAFDYFVINRNNADGSVGQAPFVTNVFANQMRYETDNNLRNHRHGDCPVYYQNASIRADLEEKFGFQGPVTGADCRQVSRDVPGALAGQWFDDSTGGQFAIASEMSGPDESLNWTIRIGFLNGTFHFVTYTPADDPELVTYSPTDPNSGRHCYHEYPSTAIHFDMKSAEEVRVRVTAGACPPAPLELGTGDQRFVR